MYRYGQSCRWEARSDGKVSMVSPMCFRDGISTVRKETATWILACRNFGVALEQGRDRN